LRVSFESEAADIPPAEKSIGLLLLFLQTV
jgi:hypothetical protein